MNAGPVSAAPDARAIVAALKGRWGGRSGTASCPAHEDRTPSLSVSETRDGRVLVHCFAGCTQAAVIGALRSAGLWGDGAALAEDPSYPGRLTTLPDGLPSQDERQRQERAREIWRAAQPIAGTLGEAYLRARGIGGTLPPTLRFAPRLFHSADRRKKPAVVCAIQNGQNKVTAIQRIFLRPDGLAKTDAEPTKPTLGPMLDGAVRMGRPGRLLGLAEGPETALSAQHLFSLPVWCSCGASRMKKVAIPAGVEVVYIFADAGRAGIDAAIETSTVLEHQGFETVIQAPKDGDWNDALRENDVLREETA